MTSRLLCTTFLVLAVIAGNAAAAPITALASHRAIYDLALTRAVQSDGVRSAKGTMVYTITDQCDGYTIESNLQMDLAFSNGIDNQIDQRFASWEAKDGRSASFRMQTLENGTLAKSYRGNVAIGADGAGTVTYETDAVRTIKLPKGTLLSTGHTLAILNAAAAGEKLLVRPVIDGSFEEGPFTVSAAIAAPRGGQAIAAPRGGQAIAAPRGGQAKAGDLSSGTAWPVSLAYFPFATEHEAPDYELNMSILANGVSRTMSQDFGKFTLGFDLVRAEPVTAPSC